MDLGYFQSAFPELIVERTRCSWSGDLLESFNVENNKWESMAENAQALLAPEEAWNERQIAGLINSIQVRELECAIISVQEERRFLIGLVRGKNIKTTDTGEIEFSELTNLDSTKIDSQENIWSADEPDIFDVSEDLKNLL